MAGVAPVAGPLDKRTLLEARIRKLACGSNPPLMTGPNYPSAHRRQGAEKRTHLRHVSICLHKCNASLSIPPSCCKMPQPHCCGLSSYSPVSQGKQRQRPCLPRTCARQWFDVEVVQKQRFLDRCRKGWMARLAGVAGVARAAMVRPMDEWHIWYLQAMFHVGGKGGRGGRGGRRRSACVHRKYRKHDGA